MTKYCDQCGAPNEDNAVHCNQCGNKFEGPREEKKEVSNSNADKKEFIEKLPLILAIIAILIGLGEGLTAPMLFGVYEIVGSILTVIIGGLIGLYLMRKEEYFIAALEFIAIAVVLCLCLGRMAVYGTILFVITGILLFYFKGMKYSSKKVFAIPILTIILVIIILIIGGGVSFVSNQNSIEVGNITQDISQSYGYYDGSIDGDIKVDSNFDYLEVHVDYYDAEGKVVYSTIGWNELNVVGGQTYHFSGMYFNEIQPTQAKLTVIDHAGSTSPLYEETINITAF